MTELKLDRSFVSDLEYRDSARALSLAVVQIGLSLGRIVVAEGVETAAQRDMLAKMGCHVAQGDLLSRALSAEGLEAWVRERFSAPVSLA